jgi:hypothetical protein
MKLKFNKKVFPVVLCMALMLITIIMPAQAASAAAQTKGFSPNTIVTNDNIKDVLAYLGVDTSKLTIDKTANASRTCTLQELKNKIQEELKKDKIEKAIENDSTNSSLIKSMSIMSPMTSQNFSMTDKFSGFSLVYTVSANYFDGVWTGVNSSSVRISGGGNTWVMDSSSTSASFTSSIITQHSVVVVGNYQTILGWSWELFTDTITSDHPYNASNYL